MANLAQSKKRARQGEKSRQRNASARSMMRTYVKRTVAAIDSGDKDAAQSAYKQTSPILDRMARKGLIHMNKAARQKSRLNLRIKNM